MRYVYNPPRDGQGESIYPSFPKELLCGQKYHLTVRIAKRVEDCRHVNYRDIYECAKGVATDRIHQLNCFRTCGPKRVWQIARQWDCDVNRIAFAVVTYIAFCPDTGQKGESGLTEPKAESFNDSHAEPPGHKPTEFGYAHEVIELNYDEYDRLNCGIKRFKVHYEEQTPDDCASYHSDHGPFFRNAQQAAVNFAQFLRCPANCSTKVFLELTPLGSTCSGATGVAEVQVQLTLQCM